MTARNEPATMTADGLTVRVRRFAAGARLPGHRHEAAYCCVLLRGVARETVDRRLVQLEPSTLSVRPPGTTHSVGFGRGSTVAVTVEVEAPRFTGLLAEGFAAPPGIVRASPRAAAAAVRLSRELPVSDQCGQLLVEGLALELLGSALRDLNSDGKSSPPSWLKRVRERLAEEPDTARSLGVLAGEFGVHPSHLAAAFRSWYGESPGDLVRRRRREIATNLMQTTALPLARIATRAGYYDQSHFTKDFKARTGATPGAFRRAIRREGSEEVDSGL